GRDFARHYSRCNVATPIFQIAAQRWERMEFACKKRRRACIPILCKRAIMHPRSGGALQVSAERTRHEKNFAPIQDFKNMRLTNLVQAIDLHAAGEHGRVIVGGVLDVPGKTMFEKMQYFQTNRDDLRLRMLREPRGYPAANCNLVLPPTDPRADAGFIIMEQTEYVPMSGTNTICTTTALLETGMLPMREPYTDVTLDTPAGLVSVGAHCHNEKVTAVTFENVPAFAVYIDRRVEVPHLGTVAVDVAWGGMFYFVTEAAPLGLELNPARGKDIVRVGEMIKAAVREQLPVVHPENPGIRDVTIGVISGPPSSPNADLKNAAVVST